MKTDAGEQLIFQGCGGKGPGLCDQLSVSMFSDSRQGEGEAVDGEGSRPFSRLPAPQGVLGRRGETVPFPPPGDVPEAADD